MGLLWELFQESQISKRKTDHRTLEEMVQQQDAEIAELCDIIGQMAQRIDEIEVAIQPGAVQ